MAWLWLTHAVALALLWYHPIFWVARDAADFARDPADDSFHATFHRQRVTWRAAFVVVVAGLASLPLLKTANYWQFSSSVIGLAAIGAAWFAYVFNPGINTARRLDYVPRYYVSFDPKAAYFPDRFLRNRAYNKAAAFLKGNGTARDIELLAKQYAPQMLKRLLLLGQLVGVAVYGLSIGFVYWCRV
ncbi:MAG: hypothetical protein JWR44_2439 [Hymenobacter sp.]|nr:hypothetical protein [Hymenobacter sp.]